MKNMKGQLEVPEGVTGTELETLYSKGEIAALPQNKKLNYITYIMSRNDELNSRAEQLADAREEGRAEGQAETIRKVLAAGLPADAIAAALGITVEECEAYRD
jgi:hypothetical protein